jgi:hypothetical protein
MPTDSAFEEAWDFAKEGDDDIEKFFRRRNTMEEKMRILDMLFEADRQRNLARQQQLSTNEPQPEINVEEGSGERPVVGDQVAEEPRSDTGEGKKGNEENGGERKEPKVKDTPKPAEQPPKEATPKVEERVADIPKPPVGKVKKPKAEAITSKPPKSAEIPKPKTKAKKAKKDEIVSEPPEKAIPKADLPKPERSISQSLQRTKKPKSARIPSISVMGENRSIPLNEAEEMVANGVASFMNIGTGEHEQRVLRIKKSEDSSFILQNPFANPFDDPNAFRLNPEYKPSEASFDIPIVKQEPIIEPQKPKDLDGFNLNSGDDLSLLPASAFTKSSQMEVDTSLLPKGWAD